MNLGIVSNCWKQQLNAGESLESLIGTAIERGYDVIELRQTALGEFEAGEENLPDAQQLQMLPSLFPEVRFNIAICVPFLDDVMGVDHATFVAGKAAAVAVAGNFVPHLRLVDLMTTNEKLQQSISEEGNGKSLANLTLAMIDVDGNLSVEHSLQSWDLFFSAFLKAREQLGEQSEALRICYDPCNLFLSGDGERADVITRSLTTELFSMVHFKQRNNAKSLPTVTEGNIDWRAQIVALNQMGYEGPALFEIDAHENIWSHLDASQNYLRQLGFTCQGLNEQ